MFLWENVKLYCCCCWSRTSQGSLWSSIVTTARPGRAAVQLQAAYLPRRWTTQIRAGSIAALWALPQTWALSSSALHPPPHCRGNTGQGVRTWWRDRNGQISGYTYDIRSLVTIHAKCIFSHPSHIDCVTIVHQSDFEDSEDTWTGAETSAITYYCLRDIKLLTALSMLCNGFLCNIPWCKICISLHLFIFRNRFVRVRDALNPDSVSGILGGFMRNYIQVSELNLIAVPYSSQDLSLGAYHRNQQTEELCISFCTSVYRECILQFVCTWMSLCVCWGKAAWVV